MTSKQNAERLVSQFYPILGGVESKDWEYFHKEAAKRCALICAQEMLAHINSHRYEWFNWSDDLEFWENISK